ncbi:MAG: hypothetical protein KC445_04875 [Anaerolineales bacterium]|nr:hypothetical protein [Anaerolineales bacterium]
MNKQWILAFAAAGIGMALAWIDQSPGWDDTAVLIMLVLLSSGLFGLMAPKRSWLWALLIGGGIPLAGIVWQGSFAGAVALVIAFVGAYVGMGVRQLTFPASVG